MKLRKNKPFAVKKAKYTVNLVSTGYFRELEIRDRVSTKKQGTSADILRSFMVAKGLHKTEFKASLELKGVGISIVDKEPKEIIYLSLYRIYIKYANEVKDRGDGCIKVTTKSILFCITCRSIIWCRSKIRYCSHLLRFLTKTAYLAMKNTLHLFKSSFRIQTARNTKFQVMIQKMKAEVETGTLNVILSTVGEISSAFDTQSTDYLSAQTMSQNQKKTLMVEGSSPHHQRHLSTKDWQDSTAAGYQFAWTSAKEIKEFRKDDVWPELNAWSPAAPELSEINTDKLYFKLMHIGAIRINITLRFEKRALNFDINQGFGALTIVYTIATSIANVSDAPLSFKELLIINIFQSKASLNDILIKNFVWQGMLQFYKLIGSSDLLGNPVDFVDKLGSGVFEFINEPRKGLIKGPKEFVGGIGKGVTSLVSGVVSASFDSVSKITGSLYSMAKNVTGQEAMPQK